MRFHRLKLIAPLCCAALASPGSLVAQGEEHERLPEIAEAIDFPVTCDESAEDSFVEAVAYLHTFWYEKASETFGAVIRADSTCAMGYWGQAMSVFHPLLAPTPASDRATGLATVQRGLALARTERERGYLTALSAYYRNDTTLHELVRLQDFAKAMAEVQRANPTDREAAIFYALALIAVGQALTTDTAYTNQLRADSILEPIFRVEPRHPGVAHYLIHANDAASLAARGLDAARRYANAIAPDIAHAQHMPSHIFARLGMWDETIAANTRAAAAARRFEQEQRLDALWEERAHADDYLVYALLQQGRDGDARRLVDETAGVTQVFPRNSQKAEYALAAIPARYALERDQWQEAMRLRLRPAPDWRASEGLTHFARALGAARTGAVKPARAEIDTLARIERKLQETHQGYWARQVRIQRLAASAWLAFARHDSSQAVRLAQAAADTDDLAQRIPVTPVPVLPARELFGDLLFELGRPTDARRAYESTLARQPNRARSLFGAGRAADRMRDHAAARKYYGQFVALLAKGDGLRPELAAAQQALAKP